MTPSLMFLWITFVLVETNFHLRIFPNYENIKIGLLCRSFRKRMLARLFQSNYHIKKCLIMLFNKARSVTFHINFVSYNCISYNFNSYNFDSYNLISREIFEPDTRKSSNGFKL